MLEAFGEARSAKPMPTPRDEVFTDGTARLLRFRGGPPRKLGAVLLVPSLINRWFVLDLHAGASVAEALVEAGFDVFCLDWGEPNDEDRHLGWDDVVERIGRMFRRARKESGGRSMGLLGYCIGGTLSAIHLALHPEGIGAFVNLAGPIDFSHAGFLGHMTNPRWFDPAAIAGAGNMSAEQMQAGFVALRPTAHLSKIVGYLDKLSDPVRLDRMATLDAWASDNIAFPASAYVRYIEELYQQNRLVRGDHAIRGRTVDLSGVSTPLLTVVTDRDAICPPKAALGLSELASSAHKEILTIQGGHVGAVVGEKAKTTLYPALARFFERHLFHAEA